MIELVAGWNYISWPGPTMSPDEAFGAYPCVLIVWYLDDEGYWHSWCPTCPPDLTQIIKGKIYQINAAEDCLIVLPKGRAWLPWVALIGGTVLAVTTIAIARKRKA